MMIPHIEGDALLIKQHTDDKVNGHLKIKPKTVIFAGNGCVEGGDLPLCTVLSEEYGRKITTDLSASMCAILAQEFKEKKLFTLKDISEIIANVGSIDDYMGSYYEFRSKLANAYREACEKDQIKLRNSEVLEAVLSGQDPRDVGVITTNWDRCFWADQRFPNVIQLHGICDQLDSIVLPSEFATDENLAEVLDSLGFKIEDNKIRQQVYRLFRGDFWRPLNAALQTAEFWLSTADRIVVWGLALHPYDSEVCTALNRLTTFCSGTRQKEIIVINPSPEAVALAKILLEPVTGTFARYEV